MNADMLVIAAVAAVAVLTGALVVLSFWRRAIRWAEAMLGIRTRMWDVASLMRLFPEGYIPPSINDWTASPDLLAEIARQVRRRKPSRLLELGSGVSTLVTASVLMRNNLGRLYSLDHDADYARATALEIEQAGLSAFAEVRYAPLGRSHVHSSAWYDESAIADIDALDLVIVDGPPTDLDPMAREPALAMLWQRLTVGGLMIFDDTDRPNDRQMIRAWAARHPATRVTWLLLEKGCVLIEKLG